MASVPESYHCLGNGHDDTPAIKTQCAPIGPSNTEVTSNEPVVQNGTNQPVTENSTSSPARENSAIKPPTLKVLILGINGFIGHHLTRRILETTNWQVYGLDIDSSRLSASNNDNDKNNPRLSFHKGDIRHSHPWIESRIRESDVVIPLAAIAKPAVYVSHPLSVFELNFEAMLPVIRLTAQYKKRLIFPSTSEVYGMCHDAEFHPLNSELVCGPIHKTRWIYSCAKQLIDRVIWGYGLEQGLDFTLFRPFNWVGTGLDDFRLGKPGSSRVTTQFLGHLVRGEDITLFDGGGQRRAFTDVEDGVDALMAIIRNEGGVASGKIYNMGNPRNDVSIRELAERMLALARGNPVLAGRVEGVRLVSRDTGEFFGEGYQDAMHRVPWIGNTRQELDWRPKVGLDESLRRIFAGLEEMGESSG